MKIITLLTSALLVSTLVSCNAKKSNSKTFVYCSEGSPTAFNPQVTTDGTSNNASAHTIYNRLVEFKRGTTEIEPALAESYSISEDKLTYTFNLRKGVKFHKTKYFTPTREFNADDVMFSFNRTRPTTHLIK
jgi:dipeptide transport system substrate-binding protein